MGLGGAEFRLPVLKGVFGYATKRAIALNLAVSLVTLLAALAARLPSTSFDPVLALWPILAALIAGSLCGAYTGASYAEKLSVERLERLILVLLVSIGLSLMIEAVLAWQSAGVPFGLVVRLPVAIALGYGIGIVSSLLGVAGGELIIPTLVFVFGADIKVAGTASVLVSLPTVMIGVVRYARNSIGYARSDIGALIAPMGLGSVVGALLGALLVPVLPGAVIKVVLGLVLIVSAVRMFRHDRAPQLSVKSDDESSAS